MAKKKSKPNETKREYIAMTNLTNGATGADFAKGDTVQDGDFPPDIIENWLVRIPPALKVKE